MKVIWSLGNHVIKIVGPKLSRHPGNFTKMQRVRRGSEEELTVKRPHDLPVHTRTDFCERCRVSFKPCCRVQNTLTLAQ